MGRYNAIHDAPRGFQMLRGARLTLEQVNDIIGETESRAAPDGSDFAYHLGQVKKEFTETNSRVGSVWVPGAPAPAATEE